MKKSLIALAVLSVAGVASAQSSVTLFGTVDVNLQRLSNNGAGAGSVTRITNSGQGSSRIGFQGTEDLGGGMRANFWYEAGINADDGTGVATSVGNQGPTTGGGGLTFNRRSTVSLMGSWGEVRLGRDLVPQFSSLSGFDPFTTLGVGANIMNQRVGLNMGGASVRASSAAHYFTPNMGGFNGQFAIYRGENASNVANASDGNGWGIRVGYTAGPIDVRFATGETKRLVGGDYKQSNIGGSYNFGPGRVMAQLSKDEAGTTDGAGWLIGGRMNMGSGEFRGSIAQYKVDPGPGADPKARKIALGYIHNLSKRTALYGTYARVRNSNGAAQPVTTGAGNPAANASASGFDIGLRHTF